MKVTYNNVYLHENLTSICVECIEPEICPICKYSIKPIHLCSHLNLEARKLTNIYICTSCHKPFIAFYDSYLNNDIFKGYTRYLFNNYKYLSPNKYIKETFENYITDTSEKFVKIFNQASEAEHLGLDEIAGIGYRKSLEFLIKDFLISRNPDKADIYKSTALANCIKNHIDDPNLKKVAQRATWLGNDQTHYEQVYTDKNISDLKKLITLTVHWISIIILTEEATNFEKQ